MPPNVRGVRSCLIALFRSSGSQPSSPSYNPVVKANIAREKKHPRGMARGATSHLAPCILLVTCFMRIAGAPPALVKNLIRGAGLRVVSEITVGLPCENWKIRGNVHNNETSIQALANVGRFQGGLRAYWKGAAPRVTDGIFSGALLLAGKPTRPCSTSPPPRGRALHHAHPHTPSRRLQVPG